MKKLLHMLKTPSRLEQYSSKGLLELVEKFNLDGFEIITCGEDNSQIMKEEQIIGYHMSFYSYWVDLWEFNPIRLLAEFGDPKTALEFYGIDYLEFSKIFPDKNWNTLESLASAKDFLRKHIVNGYKRNLEEAKSLGAEYIVFHISNVSIMETFSYELENTNERIIRASAEILNQFMKEESEIVLLMENLWWNGLNFLNPKDTKLLYDLVEYPNKGFMLDTGHLLNTNLHLRTEEEALSYIRNIIDAHHPYMDLLPAIKGIHLHQSLTGEFVQSSFSNIPLDCHPYNPKEKGLDFYEKFSKIYKHVLQIDTHMPMCFKGTQELIQYLNPDYLVFELTKADKEELIPLLELQNQIFE